MKSKSNVISAGIGYTIGNILIKGINFLSIPLFSRLLTTEEFGIYTVFIAYDSILSIIISFALYMSIRSANLAFKNKIDEYTSSITLIYFLIALFFIFIITFFGIPLSNLLGFSRLILFLLIIYSFGVGIITLYNQRIGLEYNYKKYMIISFFNSIGNICISLLFIFTVCRNNKDIGRILGVSLTTLIITMYLLREFYKKARPKFNKEYWKFGIKYSLPIVPHGISQVLLGQFDRIMIKEIVNASCAGIYSLAGNIKLILIIITESISTVWQTWFFNTIKNHKKDLIQLRATQLVIFFSLLSSGLMIIAPELIWILGGETYNSGKFVAIPMIIDAFILFLYNVIVPAEYYTQKTVYVMIGTLIAAFINVVTNYVFINKYGFIAAAYTTLFSYVCYLTIHICIAYRLVNFNVIPIKWIVIKCIELCLLATFCLLFMNQMPIRWGIGLPMIFIVFFIGIKKTDMSRIIKDKILKKII